MTQPNEISMQYDMTSHRISLTVSMFSCIEMLVWMWTEVCLAVLGNN
jgi:hypothetical protein